MRLLFLDFDGVVHPLHAESTGLQHFCWLPVLVRLVEPYDDVRIVVHSTWRFIHTDNELRALLGPLGPRFVGSAPRAPREQAIEMVLGANKGTVVSHIALDDDAKEFSGSTVNLLLVEPHLGISDVRVQDALSAWLSGGLNAADDGSTLVVTATVVGRGPDTPYVLVEDAQELQFFVIKRVFEGDWEALDSGDVVELITTRGELSRVLRARLISSSGGLDE
ncbi:HAD domain-containing protein [Hydrogenophaga sp.]|uniref:HAD domain-containing protein n=1 Tax=Hydrogenophaga sp. TaxID=1904254 RepID=UPI002FC7A3A4